MLYDYNKKLMSVTYLVNNVTLFHYLVPTSVTNLSVSNVSTTTITMNWTSSSSKDGNYVTYYNISYSSSCPDS